MAKRKIKSRYDKVPCRSLCEKLPRDLFSDTEYIWFKDPEYDKRKGYLLQSRYLLQVVWGVKPEELIPAPTVDELLEKLGEQGELITTCFAGVYLVNFKPDFSKSSADQCGRSLPRLLCECYLQFRKEKSK